MTVILVVLAVLTGPAAHASAAPALVRLPSAPPHEWRSLGTQDAPEKFEDVPAPTCPGTARTWRSPTGLVLQLLVWRCQEPHDVEVLLWDFGVSYRTHLAPVSSGPPGAFLRTGAVTAGPGERVAEIAFGRGTGFAQVAAVGPAHAARELPELVASIAFEQYLLMAGTPSRVTLPRLRPGEAVALPATFYILFVWPWRLWRNKLRRKRYGVREHDPTWVDVTAQARSVRWALRLRAVFRGLSVLSAVATALAPSPVLALVLLLAVIAGWIHPLGPARTWQRHRPARERLAAPRVWVSQVLNAAAGSVALAALTLLAGAMLLAASGLLDSPYFVDEKLDTRYVNPAVNPHLGVLLGMLAVEGGRTATQFAAFVWFVLFGAAVALRRLARRFGAGSATSVLRGNPVSPILYLRSFGDDRQKLASSVLARSTLVERLSPVSQQPFEEIVARHAGTAGPVVGCSPPGTVLPRLGVARLTIPNDGWKSQVEEWIARSKAVLVVATPERVRDGLLWELDAVEAMPDVPVLLVLGPLPHAPLHARWSTFAAAARTRSRFAALPPTLEDDGALVMLVRSGKPSETWGASRRTEWTYAMALRNALETVEAEAHLDSHPVRTSFEYAEAT